MKEAIVIKVEQKKDNTGGYHGFSTQNGSFWTWLVRFDNNDWGEFNTKDGFQPKFILGEKASYTIEPNKHNSNNPATVKHVNPDFQGAGSGGVSQVATIQPRGKEDPERQRLIIRQTCIKAVAEYYSQTNDSARTPFFDMCDKMFDWVMKPEDQEAKEIVNDALTQDFKQAVEADEDKLPF